jgi:hypothetical protein
VPPHDEQHSVVQWAVHPQQILPFDAGHHRPRCFERWGGTTSGTGGRGRSDEKHLLPLCFAVFEIGKRQLVGELPISINENTTVCVCTHVFLFSFFFLHYPNYIDLFTRSFVQVVQLRAIVLQTNQVLAQAEGVGGASLLHVPMTMKVKTEAKEGEEGDEGEQVRQLHHHPLTPLRRSTHILLCSSLFHLCFLFVSSLFYLSQGEEFAVSPVVVEVKIDETKCEVPTALRSLRPYHYAATQEGDHAASYLDWTLTTVAGGYGVTLNRDRTIEDR